MPKVVPRETFIALRARRQAYRIASSIRDPQVLRDQDEQSLIDPAQVLGDDPQPGTARRWTRSDTISLLISLDALIVLIGLLFWFA
jgi:hypothetical protein